MTAIGFSLLPIGANSFAGGQGAADFGSATNWVIGSVTLLTCLLTQVFARGFLRSLSVLVGLAVGYILSVCMGVVDFSGLSHVEVVALPRLMPFKPEFHLDAILAIVCVFLVSATETIGDTSALCSGALGREVEQKEMGGSVACDGFLSTWLAFFGCTPITSFSQNVGLAAISKVVNRFVIATGALIMILGGLFPVVGTVLTTIPQPVLGGLHHHDVWQHSLRRFRHDGQDGLLPAQYDHRQSLAQRWPRLHLQATGLFAIFPKIVQTVFAENCVAVVFLLAVVLNLVLPKEIEKKA